MRLIPFCGTRREMHTTRGLCGSTFRPRPICTYFLHSALPSIVPGLKFAGRKLSSLASQISVSTPLITPVNFVRSFVNVLPKKPALPLSASRAYVGDTVVT